MMNLELILTLTLLFAGRGTRLDSRISRSSKSHCVKLDNVGCIFGHVSEDAYRQLRTQLQHVDFNQCRSPSDGKDHNLFTLGIHG